MIGRIKNRTLRRVVLVLTAGPLMVAAGLLGAGSFMLDQFNATLEAWRR